MRSIGGKLSVRLVIGLWLLLAVTSIYWYRTTKRVLKDEFDHALRTQVETFASLLEHRGNDVELDFADELMPEFSVGPDCSYFQVWRADGTVVERSKSLAKSDLPLRFGTTAQPRIWDMPLVDGRRGRACGMEFRIRPDSRIHDALAEERPKDVGIPTGIPVRVVVALGRTRLDAALWKLRLAIGLAGLAFAGVSLLLIVWSMRRGFAPLRQLAESVDRLDPQNLPPNLQGIDTPAELKSIVARINDLVLRVREAMAREKRTTANIAHELMTPITELQTLIDVALRWPEDIEFQKRTLQEVEKIGAQMNIIASTILEFAQAENRSLDVKIQIFDPCLELDDMVDGLRDRAARRGVRFELGHSEECFVETDKSMLRIILSNLLANAIEHGPSGGRVGCSVTLRDDRVRFEITNETTDLEASDLPLMHERFWRKDPSRNSGRGAHAGLGLALAHELVEQLGLTLELHLDGKALVVELTVPQASDRAGSAVG